MTQNTDLQLSIIVIGESGVGKSLLCKRFSGENKSVNGPTIVASSWQKTLVVHDVKVKLLICDAAGQEAFRNNITSYFHKKDGVIAVYDVTNKDTFHKLSSWLDLVKQYNSNFVTLIVGNKTDCSNEKSIKRSDVEILGKENDLAFMEASAKDGNNVEKVFEFLVLKLLLKKKILSEDKLNLISSTLLLYESPVLRSSSVNAQKWVEDVSETPSDCVLEEVPTQVQNIPVIANSQKILPTEHSPCPLFSSNNQSEPTLPSQILEGTNRNEVACVSGAAVLSEFNTEPHMCNELPPIVSLTEDEITELYVQRQRRMSSNSISSLAAWDSSIVLEYEEVIRQYELARAEAAKKEPESNCTVL